MLLHFFLIFAVLVDIVVPLHHFVLKPSFKLLNFRYINQFLRSVRTPKDLIVLYTAERGCQGKLTSQRRHSADNRNLS